MSTESKYQIKIVDKQSGEGGGDHEEDSSAPNSSNLAAAYVQPDRTSSGTILNSSNDSEILVSGEFGEQHGLLLLDVSSEQNIRIKYLSADWKPDSIQLIKTLSKDPDGKPSVLNTITVEGSANSTKKEGASTDIDGISMLVDVFKRNNDTLIKQLTE